jgi:hypothetical protein
VSASSVTLCCLVKPRLLRIRCDRQSPCTACLRRGKPTECTYTTSEHGRKHAIDYRPRARSQQARQRIARIEHLVTEMRDGQPSVKGPTLSQLSNDARPQSSTELQDDGVDSIGKLSLSDGHSVYTGSTHWGTILEEVCNRA